MTRLELGTWNVLHRVHAVNWSEELPAFPDERSREAVVAEIVREQLATGVAAIGLQECSGDQLAVLRASLPAGTSVLDLRLPRLPRVRAQGATAQLVDASEHLVVVVAGGRAARTRGGAAFASDPGKGWLAVELDELVLICTHVTWGERAAAQLRLLRERATALEKPVAIVGDFNADAGEVAAHLGPRFDVLSLAAGLVTRPRSDSTKSQVIDHVAVLGGVVGDGSVIDARGASDHELVRARVELADQPATHTIA